MADKNMIDKLISILRELPEGTEVTTACLMRDAGFETNVRNDWNLLMDTHFALFEAAQEAGLFLDMSKHENKLEGLPYNLDYAVRRRK